MDLIKWKKGCIPQLAGGWVTLLWVTTFNAPKDLTDGFLKGTVLLGGIALIAIGAANLEYE